MDACVGMSVCRSPPMPWAMADPPCFWTRPIGSPSRISFAALSYYRAMMPALSLPKPCLWMAPKRALPQWWPIAPRISEWKIQSLPIPTAGPTSTTECRWRIWPFWRSIWSPNFPSNIRCSQKRNLDSMAARPATRATAILCWLWASAQMG